jgi:hypothetical protein
MKRISILPFVAGLVFGFGQNAWADDGLDVTMHVLDDVSGIDGVLLSVDDGTDAVEHHEEHGAEPAGGNSAGGDSEEHSTGDGEHDGLDATGTHDQDVEGDDLERHSEGGVEDSDVPHEPAPEDLPPGGDATPPATTDGTL